MPTPVEQISAELAKINSRFEAQEKQLADLAKPRYGEFTPGQLFAVAKDEKLERCHGFKSPREMLLKVIEAGQGKPVDKRLSGLQTKAVGSDEQAGINDAYGGFLVPVGFINDFLKVDPEADPIGNATRKIPMATPTIKIPARTDKNHTSSVAGGITVTRRPETVAATASRMLMEDVVLDASTLMGLSYATEEILVDSPQSFAAILQAGFQDQFTYHLIKERLSGTGVGEFKGILNSLDSASAGPTVSVAKEQGQAAATIVKANIDKMRSRCWGYDKAFWIANYDAYPQLANLNQAVGTGGSGMIWIESMRADDPILLKGRPIYFTEYCQTLGTQGDICLCNWGEYLEGTLQPLLSDESMHVRFVNHERAFKFWMRNAGTPWWKTALTPVNSTSKLSPFVVLDARA